MVLAKVRLVGRKARLKLCTLAMIFLGPIFVGCGTTAPPGIVPNDFEAAPRDLISVQNIVADHVVRFVGKGYIAKPDHALLDEFVTGFSRNRPESVRVTLSGTATPGQFRAVTNILIADGINPSYIVLARSRGRSGVLPGTVALTAARAIAIQPNCPGWVDHISAPADNDSNPNLGCSDVNNFAAMVADPHDLREGESNIYEEGDRGAKSVQDYRADKVKDLAPVNERFTVIPSGSQ